MARLLANGVELEYAIRGDERDPVIVLVRGLGTQMIEWCDELLDGLVDLGLRVVTFDNRDVGLSQKLDNDYALSDMADDVAGLLDALAVQRAHIFGISLGGMVAQLVAVRHPQRVACLFSVMSSSGNPNLPPMDPELRASMMQTAEGAEAIIRLDADNRVLFGSPGYPESEAVRLAAARAAYERCYCPDGVVRQMRAAARDGSRVERLAGVTAPTLVIHGADDTLVPPEGGRDTARNVPGAEFALVPGMGHNIPAALAPEIVALVGRFIAATADRSRV